MFFRRLNWNVVGWFRTVSLISYLVIGLGALALAYHSFTAPGGGFQPSHALRLGLSFTGGTDINVKYDRPVTPSQIQAALVPVGVTDARINTTQTAQDTVAGEHYSIETQVDFGDNQKKVKSALATIGTIDDKVWSFNAVGPSLGREYLIKALEALIIAIAIQFIYIAFRFGWNYIFGLVVVIALVRDAAMMIGIYALADKRADDAFLAAVLTVIGYSVMDTIVILDRIRENVKVMAGQPYDKIVNASILQTMTRSVNTLATVVVTLVALLAFGGASLQNFAFALLVGICSGGYHSIFYSAPLVNVLRERQLATAAGRREAARQALADRPRTVAEARAQQTQLNALSREEVLAARKERRKKGSAARPASGPARYRRRRPEPGTQAAGTAAAGTLDYEEPEYDEYDEEAGEHEELAMDPLDAQRAGLHDEAAHLGHEEINLNLGDEEPEAPAGEQPAAAKHE